MSQNLEELDTKLNERILQGDILGAFEDFYAEDVVMEEDGKKREGKDANREYEEQFVDALQEFHGAEIRARGGCNSTKSPCGRGTTTARSSTRSSSSWDSASAVR